MNPKYNRFVKSHKSPFTVKQQKFAAWQEAARKDIERALDGFKGQQQVLTSPIQLHNQKYIAFRASACFILHKSNVGDRGMGACMASYKPCASVDQPEYNVANITQPSKFDAIGILHFLVQGIRKMYKLCNLNLIFIEFPSLLMPLTHSSKSFFCF
jgi:hypothetical protein